MSCEIQKVTVAFFARKLAGIRYPEAGLRRLSLERGTGSRDPCLKEPTRWEPSVLTEKESEACMRMQVEDC